MKTTMELPDAVLQQLRDRAAAEGVPMRDIMIEALRRELDRRASAVPRADFAFPASGASGWLVDGVRLAQAIEDSYS